MNKFKNFLESSDEESQSIVHFNAISQFGGESRNMKSREAPSALVTINSSINNKQAPATIF